MAWIEEWHSKRQCDKEVVQGPNPQYPAHVKSLDIKNLSLLLLAEQQLRYQIGAQNKKQIDAVSTALCYGNYDLPDPHREVALNKHFWPVMPDRVRCEHRHESKEPKRVQFRSVKSGGGVGGSCGDVCCHLSGAVIASTSAQRSKADRFPGPARSPRKRDDCSHRRRGPPIQGFRLDAVTPRRSGWRRSYRLRWLNIANAAAAVQPRYCLVLATKSPVTSK